MKNILVCSNCKTENPFHKLTCLKCGSYLRERIYNLDLFKILSQLIESPFNAFKQIVFSEHKNFIYFILIFFTGKVVINSVYLSLITNAQPDFSNIFIKYIIIFSALLILLILLSFLFKAITNYFGVQTKVNDNLAIFIYSLMPYFFGLIFIFTMELIIFGGYLFSNNPSPFLVKPAFAYIFLIVEILLILWAVFLSSVAAFVQTRHRLFSLFTGILLHCIIFLITYLASVFLY